MFILLITLFTLVTYSLPSFFSFTLCYRQDAGDYAVSGATLFVTGLFQYSKVAPIRALVTGIQERLRAVEKELANLKCGKDIQSL